MGTYIWGLLDAVDGALPPGVSLGVRLPASCGPQPGPFEIVFLTRSWEIGIGGTSPGDINTEGTRPCDVGLVSRVSLLEWLSLEESTLLMIAAFPMVAPKG